MSCKDGASRPAPCAGDLRCFTDLWGDRSMAHKPLVVTDATDSSAISSAAIPKCQDLSHLNDFQYVHCCGLPHRTAQVEILNRHGAFFTWERDDGRLEIQRGHVD